MSVLLFGGTTEGRELARWLASNKIPCTLCVATAYGADQVQGLDVRAGRLDRAGMEALIRELDVALVIDATHPYAAEATANTRAVCRDTGVERIRLLRAACAAEGVETVPTARAAAERLAQTGERALLTVGSKELAEFTAVPEYRKRLVARVLPDADVLGSCNSLGFRGRNLIAMQGPFSHELNAAMLRDLSVDVLVTKDSGGAGGLPEKLSAARETGVRVLLIGRPAEEDGLAYGEAVALLADRFGVPVPGQRQTPPRMPLFVDLEGKPVTIVGGGNVATRRAEVLLGYGAAVRVLSPQLSPALRALAAEESVSWREKHYETGDLDGAALAVAATDDRAVNRRVGRDAKASGIPVSVADAPGEGSFWFPAVVRTGDLVLGMISEAGNHAKVRQAAAILRKELR